MNTSDLSNSFTSDRYKPMATVGIGGMGVVYKCKDLTVNRIVAIKLLQNNPTDKTAARLQTEAKATAKLEHPNIVKILDFGQLDDGQLYLAMEYIEGESLDQLLKRNGAITLLEAIPILNQICQGLKHSHDHGVLHRDIKPSNVLVSIKDNKIEILKLVDFGIAKIEDSQAQKLTQTGAAIGSPFYISPEAVNSKPASKESDIYSFGCLMFTILTGHPPFIGQSSLETMMMHVKEKAPSLFDISQIEFPELIENIVEKCLKKAPEDRYQTFDQVLDAFKEYEETGGNSIIANLPTEIEAVQDKSGQKVLMVLLGIVLLGTSGFLVLILYDNWAALTSQDTEVKQQETSELKIGIDAMADAKPSLMLRNNPYNYRVIGNVSGKRDDLKIIEKVERIDSIQFSLDNLKGDTLTDLAKRNVIKLRIAESELDGKTFELIAKMENLGLLHIQQCYGFTNKDLEKLTKLKHLKELCLDRSIVDLDGIESVLKIKSLGSLMLSDCKNLDFSFMKDLDRLPNLESLYIADNKIKEKDLACITDLKSLRTIEISNLPPNYMTVFSQLRLKKIEIKDSKSVNQDQLLALSQLKTLKELKATRCPKIEDSFIQKFHELRPDVAVVLENKGKSALTDII